MATLETAGTSSPHAAPPRTRLGMDGHDRHEPSGRSDQPKPSEDGVPCIPKDTGGGLPLSSSGLVKDVCPEAPPDVAQASFRYGDIFSPMFMGNLVHPPTALLRRKHLCRTGGLNTAFAWAGEDYEFFWRVSREGLGALVEASSMLYRVDAEDQMTNPELHLYIARGYCVALQRRLEQDRDRLQLPQHMIRHQMAEAYSWIAEEELLSGHGNRAAGYFWKSLLLNPAQKRALTLFPFSLVPQSLFWLIRSLKQRLRSGLSSWAPLAVWELCDDVMEIIILMG